MRILIIEGNTAPARQSYAEASGAEPNQHYAAVLKGLVRDVEIETVYPADADYRLGRPLHDYDAVVITGSALNIEQEQPEAMRQVELAQQVYDAGLPFFGSCWGLQVATVAAGGKVQRNPKGRELGIARRLETTPEGRVHPMLAGRDRVYEALAIHGDYVSAVPQGMTVLSGNDMAPVQAAEIRCGNGVFWGVQYHPEFTFDELASILGRLEPKLVEEGFFYDEIELHRYVANLRLLDLGERTDLAWRYGIGEDVLNPQLRRLEISNWIQHQVQPFLAKKAQ